MHRNIYNMIANCYFLFQYVYGIIDWELLILFHRFKAVMVVWLFIDKNCLLDNGLTAVHSLFEWLQKNIII